MSSCPCGCGRRVGFMRRKVASHGADLLAAQPLVAWGATHPEILPDEAVPIFADLALQMRAVADTLLAYGHGLGGGAALPSWTDLGAIQRFASQAVNLLSEHAPDQVAACLAAASPAHQRLIRSMLHPRFRVIVDGATAAPVTQRPVAPPAASAADARARTVPTDVTAVASPTGAAAPKPAEANPGPTRTLHFPSERSLGFLRTSVDEGETWAVAGEAQGTVTVPESASVRLLAYDGRACPSCGRKAKSSPYARGEHCSCSSDRWAEGLAGRLPDLDEIDLSRLHTTDTILGTLKGVSVSRLAIGPKATLTDPSALGDVRGLVSLRLWTIDNRYDLGFLDGVGPLEHLTIAGNVREHGFAPLAAQRRLTTLTLHLNGLPHGDLASLPILPALTSLSLHLGIIADEGLDVTPLARLQSLESLQLHVNHPGDAPLDLGPLTDLPALCSLSVSASYQPDAGLRIYGLEELTGLQRLSLANSFATRRSLAGLGVLLDLETLSLANALADDSSLAGLHGLPHLEELTLDFTAVTPAGIRAVASSLPALRALSLLGSGIPRDAFPELANVEVNSSMRAGSFDHDEDETDDPYADDARYDLERAGWAALRARRHNQQAGPAPERQVARCIGCDGPADPVELSILRYAGPEAGPYPHGFVPQSASGGTIRGGLAVCRACLPEPCSTCGRPDPNAALRSRAADLIAAHPEPDEYLRWGGEICACARATRPDFVVAEPPGQEPTSSAQMSAPADESLVPRTWDAGPFDPALPDLGPELLAAVARRLQVDEEWCLEAGRSLTWWSHRLAQQVTADIPRLTVGEPTVALRARIDLVTDVTADDDHVIGVLDILNHAASLGALVYDSDRRVVYQSATAYLNDGNRGVEDVFTFAALLGNVEAHGRTDGLAAALGGRPAVSGHPISGDRQVADGMLLLDEELRREGLRPSQFAGPVFGALPDSPYIPWVMATGDDEALSGELRFTGDIPAVVAAATGRRPETALVQISTTAAHPAWGNGALILLQLPLAVGDEAAMLAHGLNRAEAAEWTGFPQFGAWCTSGDGGIVHAAFVPNYAAILGLFPVLGFYTALRAAWAAERLA